MALRITHDMMTLGIDNHVEDAAPFSEHAVGRRHRRVDRLHAFGPAAHPRPGPGSQPLEPDRLMCALSVCRRHGDVRCRQVLACLDAWARGTEPRSIAPQRGVSTARPSLLAAAPLCTGSYGCPAEGGSDG